MFQLKLCILFSIRIGKHFLYFAGHILFLLLSFYPFPAPPSPPLFFSFFISLFQSFKNYSELLCPDKNKLKARLELPSCNTNCVMH